MKTMIAGHVFIAVDFDGTITTEQDDNFGEYILQPHCKEVLTRLHNTGKIHFAVWTCRTGEQVNTALEFLVKNNMFHLFDVVNQGFPQINALWDNESRKMSADLYIDDRAMMGNEIDWLKFEEYILKVLAENPEAL